jgi:beta-lactamase regulating signal transducer with metallopeptidase domain
MSVWGEILLAFALNAYWQGTIIAAGAWIVARWLRGAGPAAVCWMWRAALLAAVSLPLISTVWIIAGRDSVAIADGSNSHGHWAWLTLAIFCGLSIVWRAVRLFTDWLTVARMQEEPIFAQLSPWAENVVAHCLDRFDSGSVVVLRGSREAAYTAGWRRPVLVLPPRYFGASEVIGMASVVGHELAHIERRDYAWNLVLESVTALVPFHPLIAWMKRSANLAREQACDAMVVQRLVSATEYAEELVQFARRALDTPVPRHAMTVLEPNTLETRVRSLLSPSIRFSTGAFAIRMGAVLLVLTSISAAFPWRAIRVDFSPLPDVPRAAGRWSWAPRPPPPPSPPIPR